ncbi:4-amino-L-phenylalanyl-(CmlP-peptidyl-carrier-protein) 3-hydroxylase [Frankia sp. AiPs1]|uniref:MBL fold metallo-hydrolase n=1 Tax=Frankia sp. AiPa1 TaxID=573492 RepID=UPI00202B3BFD|nr:MBL fold metallo-hydrolase [Frankia sp. AiPa1]MCL9758144.1 MBL fold metallo-hydrolase [Frankia sp. AiPa1]
MTAAPVGLRADVRVEPLVGGWYAWSHLVAPATASRHLTHRHQSIIDSYVAAPSVHQQAARSPALAGGPFVDVAGDRSADVAALGERRRRERADLVALSAALDELADIVAAPAGVPLGPLYASLPPALRGCVELTYDLDDHCSFRLLEPLLYERYYAGGRDQALALSLAGSDDRPFALSTPRLDAPDVLLAGVPFHRPGVDALFASVRAPMPFDDLASCLELDADGAAKLRRLVTATPPVAGDSAPRTALRVRYIGHACVLVEVAGTSFLVDPLLPDAFEGAGPRVSAADLPERIDFALVTHAHHDHLVLETLLRLRHRLGTVVVPRGGTGALQDPSPRLALEHAGFHDVVELGDLDELVVADGRGRIVAVPFLGEHGDLAIAAKAGWLIEAEGTRLLFAADSAVLDASLYDVLREVVGRVDVVFLGMECEGAPLTWLYGPLFRREPSRERAAARRLAGSDDVQALALLGALGCQRAFVYAMGHEPWVHFLTATGFRPDARPVLAADRLVAEARRRGMSVDRLHGGCDIVLP